MPRLPDDARVQPVLERKRGRGKLHRAYLIPGESGQAVARRLDCHGHRVFVPVAHRALGLGLAPERGVEPCVRISDGFARETAPRNVRAVSKNTDAHAFVSLIGILWVADSNLRVYPQRARQAKES